MSIAALLIIEMNQGGNHLCNCTVIALLFHTVQLGTFRGVAALQSWTTSGPDPVLTDLASFDTVTVDSIRC